MLRIAIALIAFAASAGAVAQDAPAEDFGETDLGSGGFETGDAFTSARDEAGIDFILRPTQEPADEIDRFYGVSSDPDPAMLGVAIGPPMAGPVAPRPAEASPAVGAPVGPPLAGPAAPPVGRAPPRRPVDPDPFAPTGIKLGSFIFRPTFEIGVSATDNVAGGQEEEAAGGLALAGALNIRTENDRHRVEADLRSQGILYGDQEFDERETSARVRTRYDLTSLTSIDLAAGYRSSLDRYSDPDTPEAATERPGVRDFDVTLGATQRFGRFSVGVGGSLERTVHEEVALAGGGTANREELDNTVYGAFVRTSYEASGAMTPFVQVGSGWRDYDIEVDSDGFRRSSVWGELRGGLIFDFGSRLKGEVAVGGRREALDDDRLEDINAMLAEASLVWSPRRLTEIRLDVSSDVRSTGLAGASGSLLYAGALTATQQLTARVRAEAGAGLSYENFVGVDLGETTLSAFAGLSYAFNRRASAVARYSYERTDSSDEGGDFDANIVSVRLRLQR